MGRYIIQQDDPDLCDDCEHLKYESDTDTMVCTTKSGCIRKNTED